MRMAKAFVVKLLIYSAVFVYVLLDLFVFSGPLSKAVEERSSKGVTVAQHMHEKKIAAFVYRHPIYLSQLDYAVQGRLEHIGVSPANLNNDQLKLVREMELTGLIDDALLRLKVESNESMYQVTEVEVDSAYARLKARFDSDGELLAKAAEQGVESKNEFRLRLQAMLEQDAYLEKKLSPAVVIPKELVEEYGKLYYPNRKLDEQLKQEIYQAIKVVIMDQKVDEYRENLKLQAGVSHRHLDSSKDYVNREDRVNRVEIFEDIFEEPFSFKAQESGK